MLAKLGLAISRVFERLAPDPFVIAILLSVLTAALALAFGVYPEKTSGLSARAAHLLDAWSGDQGFWKLLAFGMQMCLILVTGHALATTRPVRAMIERVADLPQSCAGAAALVGFAAALTGLINWGLGLIVGALLAREVGRSMARRQIPSHYPVICAAGYVALLIWHGGLSGSAPLVMSTGKTAASVLPAEIAAYFPNGVPLGETLFAPFNLVISLGLLAIIPLSLFLLAPRDPRDMRPCELGEAAEVREQPAGELNLPDKLDRSWVIVWLLALPLLLGLARFAWEHGIGTATLNEVNACMLALGLMMHGSARSYMQAAEDGARGCAGIIVQFPIYAGIMGMMSASGLIGRIASLFNDIGTESTMPLLTFFSASIVNLFVPSGGGQWAVQGPIALQVGLDSHIPAGRMIMSVAYGDQLTNMLQPFWALPLLAITRVKARDIVGYTAVVMLIAGLWISLGLLLL